MADGGSSGAPLPPRACPACGGPIAREGNVCGQCGALITMEAALQRAGAEAQGRLSRLSRRLPRLQISRQLILLVMAIFPLAVGPAVLAALYTGWALARPGESKQPGESKWGETRWYGAILGLALVNIALSLWFWDGFGSLFLERASDLLDQLLARPGARVYEI